jgi:hypothetical protein
MEIRPVKRSVMLTFAGVVLVLAGAINLLDGIVALTKDEHFRADELLFGDLSAWGFWWLFVGLLMLWAGFQVVQTQGVRPRARHRNRRAEHLHPADVLQRLSRLVGLDHGARPGRHLRPVLERR